MSDNNSDYEEKQNKVTEEFIEVVKSWVKLDDEIREYSSKVKELKTERKDYETYILD